ncbi:recombination protein O N-terminal domain-containing protein, partial [Candidatus Bipolaricaulota bacterium]|nr:recombination protein O N-terminal domain-containing protein [Candidatus Bipolaricaulota bacterium]
MGRPASGPVVALQSLRGQRNRLGLLRADGFVLRIRDFAESDLIVTLFTEQWGKRTAIA